MGEWLSIKAFLPLSLFENWAMIIQGLTDIYYSVDCYPPFIVSPEIFTQSLNFFAAD